MIRSLGVMRQDLQWGVCQRKDPGSQWWARMHDAEDVTAFDTELSFAQIFETSWIWKFIRKSVAWVYLLLLSNTVHFVSAHFTQRRQSGKLQPIFFNHSGVKFMGSRDYELSWSRGRRRIWQQGCFLQFLGNPKITVKDLVSECTLAQR
jgi:hypothetical protein